MKEKVLITFAPNSLIQKGMAYDVQDAFNGLGFESKILDFYGEDVDNLFNILFNKTLKNFNPSIFFTFNDFGITDLMFHQNNLKIVSWYLDDPNAFIFKGRTLHRFCSFYYAYIFDKYYINDMKKSGYKNVDELKLASNIERLSKLNVNFEDKTKYNFDIAFVGGFTDDRAQIISKIDKKYKIGIWGNGKWEKIKNDNIFIHEPIDYREETPKIYNTAKINLNITSPQVKTSLNNRVFDVPASYGFIITDYRDDLKDLFKNDEIITYTDINDLNNKIDFYLNNETERKKLIEKANITISQQHSYNTRLEKVLNKINESVKEQFVLLPIQNAKESYYENKYEEARLNIQDEQFENALEILTLLKTSGEANSHLYLLLGKTYYALNKFDLAIETFNKGLEFNNNKSIIYNSLCDIYIQLNDLDNALIYVNNSLKANPFNVEAYNNLSLIKKMQKDYLGSLKIINKILKTFPDFIPSLLNKLKIFVIWKKENEVSLIANQILNIDKKYALTIKEELKKI